MNKCNQQTWNQSSFQGSAITPKITPSNSYQYKEPLSSIPYHRSISSNDIYNRDIYIQSNDNNYLQTIPEENYNPYTKTILRRNFNGRASSNLNNYINRDEYYHMNNNSFRNDSYYNNTDLIRRNYFGEGNRTNSYEYKDIPIYPQRSVDFNIKPPFDMNNNIKYREYNMNDRYYNPNYYNMNLNRSFDYHNMKGPFIKKRSYYDNYTSDMKSHYKDNFIWYGKNKIDNNIYYH